MIHILGQLFGNFAFQLLVIGGGLFLLFQPWREPGAYEGDHEKGGEPLS